MFNYLLEIRFFYWRSFTLFIFELMLFVCIICIRFDYFMFQHFCKKNLWKLKYWTTSRIDVIVRSSRLKIILNKLILKELNLLLIRILFKNDVFFYAFIVINTKYAKKTREFCDCSTHHFSQLFSIYKKIFTFVKSLIEMSLNNVAHRRNRSIVKIKSNIE